MRIKPEADNVALLFKNGFQPVWYEHEWVYVGRYEWLKWVWPW